MTLNQQQYFTNVLQIDSDEAEDDPGHPHHQPPLEPGQESSYREGSATGFYQSRGGRLYINGVNPADYQHFFDKRRRASSKAAPREEEGSSPAEYECVVRISPRMPSKIQKTGSEGLQGKDPYSAAFQERTRQKGPNLQTPTSSFSKISLNSLYTNHMGPARRSSSKTSKNGSRSRPGTSNGGGHKQPRSGSRPITEESRSFSKQSSCAASNSNFRGKENLSQISDFPKKSAMKMVEVLLDSLDALISRHEEREGRINRSGRLFSREELLAEEAELNTIRQKTMAIFHEGSDLLRYISDRYSSDHSIALGDPFFVGVASYGLDDSQIKNFLVRLKRKLESVVSAYKAHRRKRGGEKRGVGGLKRSMDSRKLNIQSEAQIGLKDVKEASLYKTRQSTCTFNLTNSKNSNKSNFGEKSANFGIGVSEGIGGEFEGLDSVRLSQSGYSDGSCAEDGKERPEICYKGDMGYRASRDEKNDFRGYLEGPRAPEMDSSCLKSSSNSHFHLNSKSLNIIENIKITAEDGSGIASKPSEYTNYDACAHSNSLMSSSLLQKHKKLKIGNFGQNTQKLPLAGEDTPTDSLARPSSVLNGPEKPMAKSDTTKRFERVENTLKKIMEKLEGMSTTQALSTNNHSLNNNQSTNTRPNRVENGPNPLKRFSGETEDSCSSGSRIRAQGSLGRPLGAPSSEVLNYSESKYTTVRKNQYEENGRKGQSRGQELVSLQEFDPDMSRDGLGRASGGQKSDFCPELKDSDLAEYELTDQFREASEGPRGPDEGSPGRRGGRRGIRDPKNLEKSPIEKLAEKLGGELHSTESATRGSRGCSRGHSRHRSTLDIKLSNFEEVKNQKNDKKTLDKATSISSRNFAVLSIQETSKNSLKTSKNSKAEIPQKMPQSQSSSNKTVIKQQKTSLPTQAGTSTSQASSQFVYKRLEGSGRPRSSLEISFVKKSKIQAKNAIESTEGTQKDQPRPSNHLNGSENSFKGRKTENEENSENENFEKKTIIEPLTIEKNLYRRPVIQPEMFITAPSGSTQTYLKSDSEKLICPEIDQGGSEGPHSRLQEANGYKLSAEFGGVSMNRPGGDFGLFGTNETSQTLWGHSKHQNEVRKVSGTSGMSTFVSSSSFKPAFSVSKPEKSKFRNFGRNQKNRINSISKGYGGVIAPEEDRYLSKTYHYSREALFGDQKLNMTYTEKIRHPDQNMTSEGVGAAGSYQAGRDTPGLKNDTQYQIRRLESKEFLDFETPESCSFRDRHPPSLYQTGPGGVHGGAGELNPSYQKIRNSSKRKLRNMLKNCNNTQKSAKNGSSEAVGKLRSLLKGTNAFVHSLLDTELKIEEVIFQQIFQSKQAVLSFIASLGDSDRAGTTLNSLRDEIGSFFENLKKASDLLEQASEFDQPAKESILDGIYSLVAKNGQSLLYAVEEVVEKEKSQKLDFGQFEGSGGLSRRRSSARGQRGGRMSHPGGYREPQYPEIDQNPDESSWLGTGAESVWSPENHSEFVKRKEIDVIFGGDFNKSQFQQPDPDQSSSPQNSIKTHQNRHRQHNQHQQLQSSSQKRRNHPGNPRISQKGQNHFSTKKTRKSSQKRRRMSSKSPKSPIPTFKEDLEGHQLDFEAEASRLYNDPPGPGLDSSSHVESEHRLITVVSDDNEVLTTNITNIDFEVDRPSQGSQSRNSGFSGVRGAGMGAVGSGGLSSIRDLSQIGQNGVLSSQGSKGSRHGVEGRESTSSRRGAYRHGQAVLGEGRSSSKSQNSQKSRNRKNLKTGQKSTQFRSRSRSRNNPTPPGYHRAHKLANQGSNLTTTANSKKSAKVVKKNYDVRCISPLLTQQHTPELSIQKRKSELQEMIKKVGNQIKSRISYNQNQSTLAGTRACGEGAETQLGSLLTSICPRGQKKVLEVPELLGEISVIFSLDSETIALGSTKGELGVYNLREERLVGLETEHEGPITSIELTTINTPIRHSEARNDLQSFNLDHNVRTRRLILTGGSEKDPVVMAWDADTLEPIKRLSGHLHMISAIKSLGDGATVATSSFDSRIAFWGLRDQFSCVQLLEQHEAPVMCLDCCLDDRLLVSGSYDSVVLIWSLNFCPESGVFEGCFLARKLDLVTYALDLSRSVVVSDVLITLESDYLIRLYDLGGETQGSFLREFRPICSARSRPDSRFADFFVVERGMDVDPLLVAVSFSGEVELLEGWDVETLRSSRAGGLPGNLGKSSSSFDEQFCFRPKSQVIIRGEKLVLVSIGGGSGEVVLQELHTGMELSSR